MAINNAIFSKSGTATTSPVAISTTDPQKMDSWQLFNDDAAITITFTMNGQLVKVLPQESISLDVRCSPNAITVTSASGTPAYRAMAVGR